MVLFGYYGRGIRIVLGHRHEIREQINYVPTVDPALST